MPEVTHVLIDPATDSAYYLGFDLLLVRAPIVEGSPATTDSRVVDQDRDDVRLAARYAAIRLALLTAWLGGNKAWRSTIDEARLTAEALASEADLSSPPTLGGSQISELDLGRQS